MWCHDCQRETRSALCRQWRKNSHWVGGDEGGFKTAAETLWGGVGGGAGAGCCGPAAINVRKIAKKVSHRSGKGVSSEGGGGGGSLVPPAPARAPSVAPEKGVGGGGGGAKSCVPCPLTCSALTCWPPSPSPEGLAHITCRVQMPMVRARSSWGLKALRPPGRIPRMMNVCHLRARSLGSGSPLGTADRRGTERIGTRCASSNTGPQWLPLDS